MFCTCIATRGFIAWHEGHAIGFIQCYFVKGSGEGWWEDETDPEARGIDSFLAHPADLNHGLGRAMIAAFTARLFADTPASVVQADPHPGNVRAIRCCRAAGFEPVAEVITPDGPALLLKLVQNSEVQDALVFTRTKHRADRLTKYLAGNKVSVERIHGNRSQAQRTQALEGFKKGRYKVLVATDIAARGIDVEALSHVVNFDVPNVPEDYVHRVGRTARAELTGDAFTFVAPDEEGDLRAIERAIGKSLPRVTLPDFDYRARPQAKLEIPIAVQRSWPLANNAR